MANDWLGPSGYGSNTTDVIYLCDRRACEKCSPECKHTKDISHAKNFEKWFGGSTYVETHKPIMVFKTKSILKKDVSAKIRESIEAQIATGVVFCDAFIDPIVINADDCIYNVSITKEVKHESETI